ncbi:MAG: RNA polymerase sigma factor [Acidobacteriota bacterium]
MRRRGEILDELLVLRCQDGDTAALETLAQRWHPRLVRKAYRLIGHLETATDVAQEAWLAIVRGLRRLDDPARFRPWAYRIVTHKSSDWIRTQQRRRNLADRARDEHQPEVDRERQADIRRLRAALAELPADRRQLLSMFYLEGRSVYELADTFAIPVGTVKSRLYHARLDLKKTLEN